MNAADVIQTRRFAAGLTLPTLASGPTQPVAVPPAIESEITGANAPGDASRLRIVPIDASYQNTVAIAVELYPRGGEAALGFSIEYDSSVLAHPTVVFGAAMPADVSLTVNTNEAGRIRLLVDSLEELATPGTSSQLVVITFVVTTSTNRETILHFGPVNECSASDMFAERLRITCGNNEGLTIMVGAAAATNSGVDPFAVLRTIELPRSSNRAGYGSGLFF